MREKVDYVAVVYQIAQKEGYVFQVYAHCL